MFGDKVIWRRSTLKLVALMPDRRAGVADQHRRSEAGYSETMAPTVVKGKVLIGTNGGEYGIRGFVRPLTPMLASCCGTSIRSRRTRSACGAEKDATGRDMHRNIAAEKRRSPRTAIPTRRWAAASGRIPRSISPPAASTSWSGSIARPRSAREPATIYTTSLVSLDLETGNNYHFQYIAHDVWDLDAVSPPVLVNVGDNGGKIIPGVIHAGKTGHVWRIDRKDCSLIRFPRRWCPGGTCGRCHGPGRACCPAPMAASSGRRSRSTPRWAVLRHQPAPADELFAQARPIPAASCGSAAPKVIPTEAQAGQHHAVDSNTGKIRLAVKTPQPDDRRHSRHRRRLVFAGEGNGRFRAYDARNGKALWTFNAGAGVNAPPSSYTVNGKQYIVVAAGGNVQLDYKRGNNVIAFTVE